MAGEENQGFVSAAEEGEGRTKGRDHEDLGDDAAHHSVPHAMHAMLGRSEDLFHVFIVHLTTCCATIA